MIQGRGKIHLASFTVVGVPKTKGSMELIDGKSGYMREGVAGSTRWRELVAREARRWRSQPHLDFTGAVRVDMMFRMPTASVIARGAGAADLDKLVRNVLDALSGCTRTCSGDCRKHAAVYRDDVQVIAIGAEKTIVDEMARPGLVCVVSGVMPA